MFISEVASSSHIVMSSVFDASTLSRTSDLGIYRLIQVSGLATFPELKLAIRNSLSEDE